MKSLFLIILFILCIIKPSFSKSGQTNNWDQIVNSAQNKTVKLHAWGGSKNINNYHNWIKTKVYKDIEEKARFIARVTDVLGTDFIKNSFELLEVKNNLLLQGLLCLPTFNYSNSNNQFIFVNGRIINDNIKYNF